MANSGMPYWRTVGPVSWLEGEPKFVARIERTIRSFYTSNDPPVTRESYFWVVIEVGGETIGQGHTVMPSEAMNKARAVIDFVKAVQETLDAIPVTSS